MEFEQYWVPYKTGTGYIKFAENFKRDVKYNLKDTDGNGNMSFEFFFNTFPSTGLIYEIK